MDIPSGPVGVTAFCSSTRWEGGTRVRGGREGRGGSRGRGLGGRAMDRRVNSCRGQGEGGIGLGGREGGREQRRSRLIYL